MHWVKLLPATRYLVGASVSVLAALILMQLPADILEKTVQDNQGRQIILGDRMKLLAPGFDLVQPWPLWSVKQ